MFVSRDVIEWVDEDAKKNPDRHHQDHGEEGNPERGYTAWHVGLVERVGGAAGETIEQKRKIRYKKQKKRRQKCCGGM